MFPMKWRKKEYDPFEEFFNNDGQYLGLNLLPVLERGFSGMRQWYPAVDVKEAKDAVVVTADVPGLTKDQIKISVDSDILTITGERKVERKEEKENNCCRIERSYGSFRRAIQLPSHIDKGKVKAVCKDGVLTITLPKTEEEKTQYIDISDE